MNYDEPMRPMASASHASTANLTGEEVILIETQADDDSVDLLALLASFLGQWRIAVSVAALAFILCMVYIFTLKSQYVAIATILPEVDRTSNNSLAALFSPRSPGAVFVGLLESKTVSNDVIDRAHLLNAYHLSSYERARDNLSGQATFKVGSDSMVVISVKDTNAKQATLIANAYLGALSDLNVSMSRNQSRELQDFFEQQLQHEKSDLYKAEGQMEKTQQQTGLIQPEAQMQIGLNAIASVRSQIVNLQVQLSSLSQSETDANPQVRNLRSQIAQLQAQEAQMENGGHSPVGAAPPAGQLPQTNLDYMRSQRDVKYYENLVGSLSTQFEGARLNESLAQQAFQIVDQATVPERKSWPPRRLFAEISLIFGIVLGILAAGAKLFWVRIKTDPTSARSLRMIKSSFGKQ